jgi:hypothetical protein
MWRSQHAPVVSQEGGAARHRFEAADRSNCPAQWCSGRAARRCRPSPSTPGIVVSRASTRLPGLAGIRQPRRRQSVISSDADCPGGRAPSRPHDGKRTRSPPAKCRSSRPARRRIPMLVKGHRRDRSSVALRRAVCQGERRGAQVDLFAGQAGQQRTLRAVIINRAADLSRRTAMSRPSPETDVRFAA